MAFTFRRLLSRYQEGILTEFTSVREKLMITTK